MVQTNRTVTLRERTAIHESSHCVAALCFGIPVVRVSIDSATPHLHRAHYHPPPGIGLQAICILVWPDQSAKQHVAVQPMMVVIASITRWRAII